MSKTKFTYVVMVLVFALGLWGILRAGSHLRPAPDVAGEWAVTWERSNTKLPARMTLNQSGRFINATLGGDGVSGIKLGGALKRTGTSRADLALKAINDPTTLAAVFDQSSQTFTGTAGGLGRWRASRVPKESSQ